MNSTCNMRKKFVALVLERPHNERVILSSTASFENYDDCTTFKIELSVKNFFAKAVMYRIRMRLSVKYPNQTQ